MSESVWFSQLIERVISQSDLRNRFYRRDLHSSLPFSKPFITIAREPGSGGAPIGQEVAKRLGFEFYDQKLIEEIAKSARRRKETIAKVDEKARTGIQDFIQGVLNPSYVSDVTFLKHLIKVTVTLAYHGDTVILGRGANFLTPRDKGLHVRITAPLSFRLEKAVQYEGHSELEAKEVIRKVSKDRRDFVRQYFDEDIRRAENYDLTINSECFDVNDCVEIILRAFQRKFPRAKRML
ncbi:MAG TPA: cytidylate kinase-like family protein [Patescibacteria group bacterium]|nr:cytidylate kinase-like family protein [Patescibacteria group bacterium]